jgi:hypothetical protein
MDLKSLLMPFVTAALGGLCTWGAVSLRKAARNVGRTELEIALDDLRKAEEEARLAKATPGDADDKAAAAHAAVAQKRIASVKRLKALLDAAGGEPDKPE